MAFADGQVTELTANVIDEAMHAQSDEDGKEYVLLDSLVDYRRSQTTLSLECQKIVVTDQPALHRTAV